MTPGELINQLQQNKKASTNITIDNPLLLVKIMKYQKLVMQ